MKNKYVKMDPVEHVLNRPGMYIGSVESEQINLWCHGEHDDSFVQKNITYIPGLYKIFDEIIVNTLDHIVRLKDEEISSVSSTIKHVKEIKILIDYETGEISVYNDGNGLDIYKHDEHNIWIPELIFGNLLTSTNYDDSVDRIIGGTNGIGSKTTNIYSSVFSIETVDVSRKLLYKQEWRDNMSKTSEPTITKYTKYPYTKITFTPDYARFKIDLTNDQSLKKDTIKLFKKRVYDMCATSPDNVKIFFNDEKIDCKNFDKYTSLYTNNFDNPFKIYQKVNDRWEYAVGLSKCGFNQISFVNGVCTLKGGKHVEYVINQITKKLADMISKKKKITIKPTQIKENLFLFLKSTIVNPTFDSQSKEHLTTPFSKFGSKIDIDDKIIEKLYKCDVLLDRLLVINAVDFDKTCKKTDGKKQSTIRGIPKLDDANWAGTSKSDQCSLILTEGDSAKTMAVSGLSIIGRDKFGIFPLKGKLLNCKDTLSTKISNNEEINNLKKIIGLETGKSYDSVHDLRYGKIILMTDSDVDGSHIKGLVFNMFHSLWPSLFKIPSFLSCILTPIVKVSKNKSVIKFYNLTDYENWSQDANIDKVGWNCKYFKGLGTSTSVEAKEYFKDMNIVNYKYETDKTECSLDLAFNKKKSDDRKTWIANYDKQNVLNYNTSDKITEVTYTEFVDKELLHFSVDNNNRTIPSICDGLKQSTRKILYCCFKRNLTKDIKVAQLAGYVSENSAYHHGENSLLMAIIGLAQNFVGSNNINLLVPSGQFGSRIQGGKDSASPRYIFTRLHDIVPLIFHKDDAPILNYIYEENMSIEPDYYHPIIPMILINGSIGIGTGHSTNIPCYNPIDVINCLYSMLDDNFDFDDIQPWYRGFTGQIENNISRGVFTKLSPTKVLISELPIGMWTEDFKLLLEHYIEANPKIIKDYENHYTEEKVIFHIQFYSSSILEDYISIDNNSSVSKIETELKLHSSKMLNTSNMTLCDANGNLQKYSSAKDILIEYFHSRLLIYSKRKNFMSDSLKTELLYINAKIKFISDIIDGKLTLLNQKITEIYDYLYSNDIPKIDDKYDYLIKMPIQSLTREKILELDADMKKKASQLILLEKTLVKDMWKNDLNDFKQKYLKICI